MTPASRVVAGCTTPRTRTGVRGRWGRSVAAAVAVAGVVTATGYAVAAGTDGEAALGPGVVTVEVGIQHSRFDIGSLRVQEGTIVEFVVRNDDPIDHELVVGTPEVHRRHAEGTEARHPPIPGEVSVAPRDTAMTFYEFTEPGSVTYACHLPGHLAYGMTGTIEVVAAA
ncbi:MAG: plastocyanin/azurin family copper-binding protein [Acidimicrobiales bacterium]